jgi:hypothetical protein
MQKYLYFIFKMFLSCCFQVFYIVGDPLCQDAP